MHYFFVYDSRITSKVWLKNVSPFHTNLQAKGSTLSKRHDAIRAPPSGAFPNHSSCVTCVNLHPFQSSLKNKSAPSRDYFNQRIISQTTTEKTHDLFNPPAAWKDWKWTWMEQEKKPGLQSKSNDWQVNASGRTNKIMRTDRVRLVDGIGLVGAEIKAKKKIC